MDEEVLQDEGPEGIHPETLTQGAPSPVIHLISIVIGIVSSYGWFIFLGTILCYYIWRTQKQKIEDWKEAAAYHKDPDKFVAREQSVALAREKMQQRYDALAKERAEKLKEEEERRRVASANAPPGSQQDSNGPTSQNKTQKPRLRPAFNPLMGDTSSCAWRPGGGGRRSGGG